MHGYRLPVPLLASSVARELVTADAAGDAHLASQAWREAGLREHGLIPVADLNRVRQTLRRCTTPA
ncbi:hypothetical protein [Streptomyces lydicus]|uniref:hypothetical protein n=1 Tax=Streptomyces lydicus TaxID=47763 RepID=UPI003798E29E